MQRDARIEAVSKICTDSTFQACTSCERTGRAAECTSTNDQFARGKERSYVSTLETRIDRLQAKLEEARARAVRHGILQEQHKSDKEWLGDHDLPESVRAREPKIPKVFVAEREGRPSVKFTNVGGKFLDTKDLQRRRYESERRSKIRVKRREKKQAESQAFMAGQAAALHPTTQ